MDVIVRDGGCWSCRGFNSEQAAIRRCVGRRLLAAWHHVAAYPDGRLITHIGPWSAPVWLRTRRMSPITNYVAGTTQSNPARCVEVRPDGWSDVAPACGNSACAYGPGGNSSSTWIVGIPIMGWVSVTSPIGFTQGPTPTWTTNDISTSGPSTTALPWAERQRAIRRRPLRHPLQRQTVLLEGGTCRVIRFSKQGDKLSIGFFRVDVGAFVAHWLTVAEIAELKDITDQEEPENQENPKNRRDLWISRERNGHFGADAREVCAHAASDGRRRA